jgi:RNA polymerase sigma-70 factor (ECF subfamily)
MPAGERYGAALDDETGARIGWHLRAERGSMVEEALPDFSRIHEAYQGKVRAYAARLIGAEEADDVAQEVFIRLRRSLGTLEEPSKLGSWIYAITLNVVRDAVRKRASRGDRQAPDSSDPLAPMPDVAARTPEETAIRTEMVDCYLDYVKQLPPAYHEVYVLSEFEELSNGEIARRLSISLGTVKIRLHRARNRLFAELRRNCTCYVNERGELMGAPKGR